MDVLTIVAIGQAAQPEAPQRGQGGPPVQHGLHFLTRVNRVRVDPRHAACSPWPLAFAYPS